MMTQNQNKAAPVFYNCATGWVGGFGFSSQIIVG